MFYPHLCFYWSYQSNRFVKFWSLVDFILGQKSLKDMIFGSLQKSVKTRLGVDKVKPKEGF